MKSRINRYGLTAALLVAAIGCGRSRTLANEGLKLMEAGKNTSALELFDRALKSNSREPLALYGKGMLLAEEPITQEIALAMLKNATQETELKDSQRTRAYLRLAEIYATRGEKEEAMMNLGKVSGSARPVDGYGMRRLVGIYLTLKEKDRAREALTAYLETHPQDEETEYFLLKLYALHLKDNKASARLCAKVDWQKSRIPKYLINCSKALAIVNDYTTALSLLDLHSKRAGTATVPAEINELREAIVRKRGRFELSEADF